MNSGFSPSVHNFQIMSVCKKAGTHLLSLQPLSLWLWMDFHTRRSKQASLIYTTTNTGDGEHHNTLWNPSCQVKNSIRYSAGRFSPSSWNFTEKGYVVKDRGLRLGRRQDFLKGGGGGGHAVWNRGYSPEWHVYLQAAFYSMWWQKKTLKGTAAWQFWTRITFVRLPTETLRDLSFFKFSQPLIRLLG